MALVKSKQETKTYESKRMTKKVIGTLGEKSLHSSLKDWYAMPGDCLETEVDGFHIDIIRNNLLIEIKTTNFLEIRSLKYEILNRH